MELRQLKYYSVLCRYMSFSEAAHHLGISQPNLTVQIKKLERELHVQLVNRTVPMTLTMSGSMFFNRIQKIVGDIDNLCLELNDYNHVNEKIRVGIPTLLSEVFLKKFDKYNMFNLLYIEDNCENLKKLLEERDLDFCILPEDKYANTQIHTGRYLKYAKDDKTLQNAACKVVAPKDYSFSLNKADFHSDQILSIKHMISTGYHAIFPDILDLSEFYAKENKFNLYLCWNKEMYITSSMGLFIDEIKES